MTDEATPIAPVTRRSRIRKAMETANPLAQQMTRTPAPPQPEAVAAAEPEAASAKKAPKAKKEPERTGPVNVITDRSGQIFDPEVHAVHDDGVTPHADSAGNFIRKADHYDGAKKAFYGDSYRHA